MSDTGTLVYVVDDDTSAREGVAALIRSAGLTPKTFASAEEFLAAPRPKTPSCLVLDVSLPGVSGLDLQQELTKSSFQIPIVFLTGHGDIPMTVRALKAGGHLSYVYVGKGLNNTASPENVFEPASTVTRPSRLVLTTVARIACFT